MVDHVRDRLLAGPVLGVEARVDHEAAGTEHLVAEAAEVVERVLLEARLPSEPLGIERPALDIRRERHHLAEDRQALELLRDRDLEVVARHGLVVRERAHRELRDLAHVAQVREEHAVARAVERARLVVRLRRRLLGEHRHALDLDAGLGLGREIRIEPGEDLVDDRLVVLQRLRAALVRVGIELVRALGDLVHALADRALGQALVAQDLLHLAADALDLFQPELVHLVGRHVGRGLVAHLVRVERVAVRQAPDAVVARRLRLELLEVRDQALVGRVHRLLDRVRGVGEQPVARGLVHLVLVDLVELLLERGVQHVLLGLVVDEALHLRQNLVHRELRRDDALGLAELQPLDHLVELRAEERQADVVVLRLLLVRHLVLLRQEVRQRALDAEQLVHREVVVAELVALDLAAHEVVEDVVAELRLALERVAVVLVQHRVVAFELLRLLRLVLRRRIRELPVVRLDAEFLEQPHAAQELRVVQRELEEHPVVEPVDAPGLEVPEVDEQHGADQDQYAQAVAEPLEQTFHRGNSPGDRARVAAVGGRGDGPMVMRRRGPAGRRCAMSGLRRTTS